MNTDITSIHWLMEGNFEERLFCNSSTILGNFHRNNIVA